MTTPIEDPPRTLERLEERDRARVEFLAMASHQLRTPITAIRGFARMLIRDRGTLSEDDAISFLRIIERQCERLARLAEDLLLVSRLEAHAMHPAIRRMTLSVFIQEVVEPFAAERPARVRLVTPPEPTVVAIDPGQAAQAVGNLVHNALKFSPVTSTVVVEASVSRSHLTLSVTDEGPGIPEGELQHIFDRFHQGTPLSSEDPGGAGLGLYIAKQLVEGMGGTISVRSMAAGGSTFTVTLPAGGR